MDKLSQVGRILRKTQDNTNYALNRDILKQSLIHRTRDIFDNVLPFEFEFDTPNVASTSYLTLIFTPPSPSECGNGCFSGACDVFIGTNTVLTLTYEAFPNSVQVFVDEVVTTNFTITGTSEITLGFIPTSLDTVKICYVYKVLNCISEPEDCTTISIYDTFTRTSATNWSTGEIAIWTNSGSASFTRSVNGSRGIIQAPTTQSNTGGSNASSTIGLPFALDLDFEFADFDANPYPFRPNLIVQFVTAPSFDTEAYVQIFPIEGTHATGPEISTYSGSVHSLSSGLTSGHLRAECTSTGFTVIVNDAIITSPYRNSSNNPVTISSGTPGRIWISLVQSSLQISPISSIFKVYIDNVTIGTNCIFT